MTGFLQRLLTHKASSGRIVTTAKRQEIAINDLLKEIGEKHGGDVDLF